MHPPAVYAAIRRLVDPTLAKHGFTTEGSKRATYFRRVDEDLSHFIMFDLFAYRTVFDVKVFPSSRRLFPETWVGLADSVGIPSGNKSGLNAKLGVGHGGSEFSYRSTQALEAGVRNAVLPALEFHALPYLDQFRCVEDIVPILEHPQWAARLRDEA